MSSSSSLTELIDATPWIDVHEHLVEERHRLRDGAYEFVEVFGEDACIPADWSALIVGGYALDDPVSAGLPPSVAQDFTGAELGPVEKWDLVAPWIDAARLTGSMRAVDVATERRGIEVGTLDDYVDVIEWVFQRYGDCAVAVKCFWGYFRSLAVAQVDSPPRSAFARLRSHGEDASDRRSVEDYLFRRCVEPATAAGLPVKIHLGSLARNGDPHLSEIFRCVADITPLVQEYPRTTFVLMHMAWPLQEQLLALAKHQPNVVVEMSWTWTAAPRAACDFVQRFLTTVPANKLLCFGGDSLTVENVVGQAELARRGLQRAPEGLVESGWTTIDDAARLVPLLMRDNALRILPTPEHASRRGVA